MMRFDTNKPSELITGNEGKERVSLYTIKEFENSIIKSSKFKNKPNHFYFLSRRLYWFWIHLSFNPYLFQLFCTIGSLFLKRRNQFVVFMGARFPKWFPYIFSKGYKSIYLFDAWPRFHDLIIRFSDQFELNHVFVSSSQATEALNKKSKNTCFVWIPEAIDANEYKFYSFENKTIDVLTFGRKNLAHHNAIVDQLRLQGLTYVYSTRECMAFPDHFSLIDGLAKTKISVCFPASITNPENAEGIETLTNRFLQSMISKCLIIGKAPEELIRLFGYNPVIEADIQNPVKQILDILENYNSYGELIEKNYNNVLTNHTWEKRWNYIYSIILNDKEKQI